MTTRLATSLIALSTAVATPAIADVTAADVWSNQQALYSAMGMTLSGIQSGSSLINPEIRMILPMGLADLTIRTVAAYITDNGNGTVTISYPSPMAITVEGSARDTGAFTLFTTMTHDGYDIIASGTPGDITYVSSANNVQIEMGDLLLKGGGFDSAEISVEGSSITLPRWSGTSNVTEGNLITYTSSADTDGSTFDFTFTAGDVISTTKQTSLAMQSEVELSLPVGGSDLLNLSDALRNGLDVAIAVVGNGTTSGSETRQAGTLISSDTTTTGAQSTTVTFNENGLGLSGGAADIAVNIYDPTIFPAPLAFGMADASVAYDIPVNASEAPQDFRLATAFEGVTLDDTIWNLIDPAGQLPRVPAEVSFDITGLGTTGTDLLDILAMTSASGPPDVEIDEITIENLRIAAIGAEATAAGAMTFDWTDFQTIPGIPRPEGAVTVNLNGANALMDRLAAMGLIPEDQLMMPRMMMGMFATPVGDDMLESVLEVNSEGHVLANGQRLQ